MLRYCRRIACVLLLTVVEKSALAQAPNHASQGALRVFLDCPVYICDFDFFRSEIASVNWVRDRQEADVQILVTTQETGSGGTEYTLTFIGLERTAGIGDTLRYAALPSEAADVTRRALV